MKFLKKIANSFFIILFSFNPSSAQDLSGKWEGFLDHTSCNKTSNKFLVTLEIFSENNTSNGVFKIFYYDLSITNSTAVSLFQFKVMTNKIGNNFTVNFSASDLINNSNIETRYHLSRSYQLILNYFKILNVEKLSGTYSSGNGAKGKVYLTKQGKENENFLINNINTNLLAGLRAKQRQNKENLREANEINTPKKIKDDSIKAVKKLVKNINYDSISKFQQEESFAKLQKRKLDLQKEIVIKDSVYVEVAIYDDAIEDSDIISLYLDSTLLLHKAIIKSEPIKIKVYKPSNKNISTLQMLAENLGYISPNTAYVVITSGRFQQSITFKSDLLNNASIIIKWE